MFFARLDDDDDDEVDDYATACCCYSHSIQDFESHCIARMKKIFVS